MGVLSEITDRDQLVRALETAAALEHNVICQYLYAAHSLKSHPSESGITPSQIEQVREWQASILAVARGEMEHLGLVCNLLSAIGARPSFRRDNFPQPGMFCPPGIQFELIPFSDATMNRFALFEESHGLAGSPEVPTIGDLYEGIRRGIRRVDAVAPLFVGDAAAQVSNRTIGLPERWYDMQLRTVASADEASDVIDQILEAGDHEGPTAHPTHHDRFVQVREENRRLSATDPHFQPARPVVSNPVLRSVPPAGCTMIAHPITRMAVQIFNAVYETMLLMMTRYYAAVDETEAERKVLENLTLFPIMTIVLRPMAEVLTQMPVADDPDDGTAGPTFEFDSAAELPVKKTEAWQLIDRRLGDHAAGCAALTREIATVDAPWAVNAAPRIAFLTETLEAIRVKFDFYMQTEYGLFWSEYRRLSGW